MAVKITKGCRSLVLKYRKKGFCSEGLFISLFILEMCIHLLFNQKT